MFLPPEESRRSEECCTFDGTKSNYLFDEVNKWFVLQDLESRLKIKEKRQKFWHSPTLIIPWIRDPSRIKYPSQIKNPSPIEPFSRFFQKPQWKLRSYIFIFSFNRSFRNSSIFLLGLSSYLVHDTLHRLCRAGSW